MTQKTYLVQVEWTMTGTVRLKANSIEEAEKNARQIALDTVMDAEYLSDSFKVNQTNQID